MTIKDVARRAGVSISTVSNALNGRGSVSEETRERIMAIARDMDYVPNINAKLMKSRRTGNIGLFLPYVDGEFYAALISTCYRACREAGYAMFIHVADNYDGRETMATMLSCNIDGAIVLNDHIKSQDLEMIRQRAPLPVVFLDRKIVQRSISSIVIDNAKGINLLLEYLVHTGHRKIACVRGYANFDGNERHAAFLSGMKALGLPVDIVLQSMFDENIAYAAVRGMLTHTRPDAVLCANDVMAVGAMRAIADIGLNVPRDISVVGFDDISLAATASPPLTTVHYSIAEFGARAVMEIKRILKDPESEGTLQTLDVSLTIRESVAIRFTGKL